jgi:hypothetical protein
VRGQHASKASQRAVAGGVHNLHGDRLCSPFALAFAFLTEKGTRCSHPARPPNPWPVEFKGWRLSVSTAIGGSLRNQSLFGEVQSLVATIPEIGRAGAQADKRYCPDGVHPTDARNSRITERGPRL